MIKRSSLIAGHRAFTLIEIMAVVTLIGLLAAATAWSLADDAQQAGYDDVIDRLRYADYSARMSGQRLGPSTLMIDLERQRLWVQSPGKRQGSKEDGHTLQLPAGYRIADVSWIDPTETKVRQGRPRKLIKHSSGIIELVYSSQGISQTYVMKLTGPGQSDTQQSSSANQRTTWMLVSGLTGQAILEDEEEAINLVLEASAQARPDAH